MTLNQNLEHKKELTAFNILKYRYCANQSRDISHDHFTKIRKLLTNWWPVWGKKSSKNFFLIDIKYFYHFTFGMNVHGTSRNNHEKKHHFKYSKKNIHFKRRKLVMFILFQKYHLIYPNKVIPHQFANFLRCQFLVVTWHVTWPYLNVHPQENLKIYFWGKIILFYVS